MDCTCIDRPVRLTLAAVTGFGGAAVLLPVLVAANSAHHAENPRSGIPRVDRTGVRPRLRTPGEATSVMIEAMRPEWVKAIAVMALVVVLVGILVPDASGDDDPASATASTTVSTGHTGSQPFGCQHEEDCFCCAHIAPTAQFVLPMLAFSIRFEPEADTLTYDSISCPPYHPPRT